MKSNQVCILGSKGALYPSVKRVLYPSEVKKVLSANAIFLETIRNDPFQSQSLENIEAASSGDNLRWLG